MIVFKNYDFWGEPNPCSAFKEDGTLIGHFISPYRAQQEITGKKSSGWVRLLQGRKKNGKPLMAKTKIGNVYLLPLKEEYRIITKTIKNEISEQNVKELKING